MDLPAIPGAGAAGIAGRGHVAKRAGPAASRSSSQLKKDNRAGGGLQRRPVKARPGPAGERSEPRVSALPADHARLPRILGSMHVVFWALYKKWESGNPC